jgi:WD40 repeat protein
LEFVKPIRSIQFANTNNLLVLGGDDAMVYVVSVSSQQLIAEKLLSAPITALGFSWCDERLAVASVDGLLALLDPKDDFELVGEIDSSDSAILTLDWSSKNLGIGRSDGSVTVHDTDKVFGNFFVPQVELRKRKAIRSLAFGVSGRFLGKQRLHFQHQYEVRFLTLCLQHAAVGGDDGKLSVYSEKGDWVLCHQVRIDSTIKAVNWSPTGRYLGYCATSITQVGPSYLQLVCSVNGILPTIRSLVA